MFFKKTNNRKSRKMSIDELKKKLSDASTKDFSVLNFWLDESKKKYSFEIYSSITFKSQTFEGTYETFKDIAEKVKKEIETKDAIRRINNAIFEVPKVTNEYKIDSVSFSKNSESLFAEVLFEDLAMPYKILEVPFEQLNLVKFKFTEKELKEFHFKALSAEQDEINKKIEAEILKRKKAAEQKEELKKKTEEQNKNEGNKKSENKAEGKKEELQKTKKNFFPFFKKKPKAKKIKQEDSKEKVSAEEIEKMANEINEAIKKI